MKPYYPVDMQFKIIQRFGENVKSYPKRQGHPGTDWQLPTLNNLYAVADAKVKLAGYRPESGYGREVDLLVNNRWLVIYGHLSEYHVQQGDMVKRGDVIGLSGGDPNDSDPIDGMSGGAHLHLEVRDLLKPQVLPLIGAVDPEIWLADETLLPLRDVVPCNDVVTPVDTVSPVLSLPSASGGKLRVITDLLRMRNEPNTDRDNPPVAQLFRGAVLNATGDVEGNWHKVELWVSDGDGTFLEEVKE